MFVTTIAGLLLGASPAVADDTSHRTQLDHRGHRVDVVYRGATTIAHDQRGTAGAPGRPSSLHCVWRAAIAVDREARSAAGHVVTRRITATTPLRGTRPGWCSTQRRGIAAEVAARGEAVRDHLLAVAQEDRDTLVAELDAAHGADRS